MKGLLAALLGITLAPPVLAVDVPLTIREEEGVTRSWNPVNSGVPLPKGAVRAVNELRLVDDQGRVLLASIEPRCRWLGDRSLKWVSVHFLTDLEAGGTKQYRLVVSDADLPKSPLRIRRDEERITVVTGPAKFVIPTSRLAPFEQVYLRSERLNDFSDADGLLARPASVILQARNGQSRVQDLEAEIVGTEETFVQKARIGSVEVEEDGPGRAVIAIKGTFSTEAAASLDYTARLYFYSNSSLVQMTLSVRNRQLIDMARFVGIERLAVELPMRLGGDSTASVDMDGETIQIPVQEQPLSLFQSARNRLEVTLPNRSTLSGEKSAGWVQWANREGQLTAGNRWFWQTYPKGVEVLPDGTVSLELKSRKGDRIDLYTAGAKTHFLFFHFAKPGDLEAPSIAAGTQHPLHAASSPDWYCQETRVFGDLYSKNLENYDPKHHDLVRRFQKNVDGRLRQIVENRPRENWSGGVDEFGWLDFGSGLHHQSRTSTTSAESWWDSNYYDFPHAALVNYLRTGDLINLRTAEEAGLHLADVDICHSFPGQPELAGSPRSGPVIGHFRNYTRGRLYMGHSSFTFYKNESLYELYYLTGDSWYRDVALMSSDFAMARWGQGALRNLAHGIWGVLSAYHDTHDEKYLERAKFFVDEWGKPWQEKYDGGFNDQHWMYGLLFEAYGKYYAVTGDEETARYLVRALDDLLNEFWTDENGTGSLPGINVYGFGLGYELTGREHYLQKGLRLMELLSRSGAEGDRVKTFAQNFRSSPYFLTFLTKDYRPRLGR